MQGGEDGNLCRVLRLKAPAKINLTLEVMARRDDGYHALRSLMVPVGIYDEIAVEPAAARRFACADERCRRRQFGRHGARRGGLRRP